MTNKPDLSIAALIKLGGTWFTFKTLSATPVQCILDDLIKTDLLKHSMVGSRLKITNLNDTTYRYIKNRNQEWIEVLHQDCFYLRDIFKDENNGKGKG